MQQRRQRHQDLFLPKRKEKEIDKKPLSGNDVILPKSSYKEPSNGAITIINVLVGVVIGAALNMVPDYSGKEQRSYTGL